MLQVGVENIEVVKIHSFKVLNRYYWFWNKEGGVDGHINVNNFERHSATMAALS